MKKSRSKLIKIVLVLIITIVVITIASLIISRVVYQNKYKEYATKIESMGLNQLYSDGKTNAYEYVTRGEAISMIIKGALNIESIEDYGFMPSETNPYLAYIEFSNYRNIVPELMIDESNINGEITRLELLKILGRAKEFYLGKELKSSDLRLKINGAHKLGETETLYLKDLVNTNVFNNSGSIYEKTKVRRGEFNKAIYEFSVSVSSITDGTGEVETDKSKLPSNADQYPFILKGMDKTVYEKPFINQDKEEFESPNELFRHLKNSNDGIIKRVQNYMDLILNVDYNTIDEESIQKVASENFLYVKNSEIIGEYVNYIKEHKIKLSGDSKIYVPAIYYDGITYRIRLVVTFKIEEGDTLENVLLGDVLGEKVTYLKDNSLIIDFPLENKAGSNELYPGFAAISSYKID